ncbi:MAG: hypothetical protein M0P50_13280, partial [Bacteroidales bacterium]|nr:hypothetical protein [Bacteroidales bacterium]
VHFFNNLQTRRVFALTQKASPHFTERLLQLNNLSHTVNSFRQKSCPLNHGVLCLGMIHGVACPESILSHTVNSIGQKCYFLE